MDEPIQNQPIMPQEPAPVQQPVMPEPAMPASGGMSKHLFLYLRVIGFISAAGFLIYRMSITLPEPCALSEGFGCLALEITNRAIVATGVAFFFWSAVILILIRVIMKARNMSNQSLLFTRVFFEILMWIGVCSYTYGVFGVSGTGLPRFTLEDLNPILVIFIFL